MRTITVERGTREVDDNTEVIERVIDRTAEIPKIKATLRPSIWEHEDPDPPTLLPKHTLRAVPPLPPVPPPPLEGRVIDPDTVRSGVIPGRTQDEVVETMWRFVIVGILVALAVMALGNADVRERVVRVLVPQPTLKIQTGLTPDQAPENHPLTRPVLSVPVTPGVREPLHSGSGGRVALPTPAVTQSTPASKRLPALATEPDPESSTADPESSATPSPSDPEEADPLPATEEPTPESSPFVTPTTPGGPTPPKPTPMP